MFHLSDGSWHILDRSGMGDVNVTVFFKFCYHGQARTWIRGTWSSLELLWASLTHGVGLQSLLLSVQSGNWDSSVALLSVKPGTFRCPQESPLLLHSKTWSLFVLLPLDSCSAQLLSVSSSFFINTEVTRANAWRGTGYIHQIKLLNHKNQEGAETLVSPLWQSYKKSVTSTKDWWEKESKRT